MARTQVALYEKISKTDIPGGSDKLESCSDYGAVMPLGVMQRDQGQERQERAPDNKKINKKNK